LFTVTYSSALSAPVSKKNQRKERDPEMSSTRKNNKWYFGAKGHIGVQAQGKPIIHSVAFGTAKEHDKTRMTELFHRHEEAIFGDSTYGAQDEKRGAREHPLSSSQKKRNRKHSGLRAKV